MSPATTSERTLGQWAELAEQAIRVLTHRTRPALGELSDPAAAAEVIADLASLSAMLPQLLDQLADWLLDQQQQGRLRVDSLAPQPDIGQTAQATAGALAHAGQCARRAGHALHTAHQHAAHLAPTDTDDPDAGGADTCGADHHREDHHRPPMHRAAAAHATPPEVTHA